MRQLLQGAAGTQELPQSQRHFKISSVCTVCQCGPPISLAQGSARTSATGALFILEHGSHTTQHAIRHSVKRHKSRDMVLAQLL